MAMIDLIEPDWPAPARVRACTTTRHGGVSQGRWTSLNLGTHVGDDPEAVHENRRRIDERLGLPAEPHWLNQVHGTSVRYIGPGAPCTEACADAAMTYQPGAVCVVMTADCLPVLFCNRHGDRVAAAHAGWRGLLDGVLEATVAAFDDAPGDLMAWLGPAIGPTAFEVGPEVREAFLDRSTAEACFRPGRDDRWLADLYGLAARRLDAAGVMSVSGGDRCTFSEPETFFSYRRDGITGRMASLIWLQTD
jgi:YfiH family protein